MAYIESGNATAAYRQCFPTQTKLDSTVNPKASHLLTSDKIQTRLTELRQDLVLQHQSRVQTLLDGYQEAFQIAKDNRNPIAMTKALDGMTSVLGVENIQRVLAESLFDKDIEPVQIVLADFSFMHDNGGGVPQNE